MAKILYISFGYEPYWSGGMVDNQMSLMRNLKEIGHEIFFFAAMRYDYRSSPYLANKKINGINTFEIVNSPNPYDPYAYPINPDQQCSHVKIEWLTQRILNLIHPDVVHIGDLRMHCASVIEIVKNSGIPILKTIENFWDLCPKSDLMLNDEAPCFDYKNGINCQVCLSRYDLKKIPSFHRIKGSVRFEKIYSFASKLKYFKRFARYRAEGSTVRRTPHPAFKYRQRRQFFVDMLNKCDRIHVTSTNTKDRLVMYGVDPQIITNIPLSTEGISLIISKPYHNPGTPLVFGYRGKLHTRKGIQILLDAFSRLDQTGNKLIIYGDGNISLLMPYIKRKLNIEYRGTYRKNEINKVLGEIDIGIVPSICEESFGIVGLEYINARIPVIGSDLGGIREWLVNGENGYLFKAGDVSGLYLAMRRLFENQTLVSGLQQKIKRWKDITTYVQEMNQLYSELQNKD